MASLSTLGAGGCHVHGVELEAVHAGPDGRIILAELPGFGFVPDLQDRDPERSSGRQHGAIRQKLADLKLLFAVSAGCPIPPFFGGVRGFNREGGPGNRSTAAE